MNASETVGDLVFLHTEFWSFPPWHFLPPTRHSGENALSRGIIFSALTIRNCFFGDARSRNRE